MQDVMCAMYDDNMFNNICWLWSKLVTGSFLDGQKIIDNHFKKSNQTWNIFSDCSLSFGFLLLCLILFSFARKKETFEEITGPWEFVTFYNPDS